MTPLAFVDVESTSLRPDKRAWEIAVVRRDGSEETELVWYVGVEYLDLGNAESRALQIGRFYERHPEMFGSRDGVLQLGLTHDPEDEDKAWARLGHERVVLAEVANATHDAYVVGMNVAFDVGLLERRMRANGICPTWDYHSPDAEALAAGCLAHMARSIYANSDGDNERIELANHLANAAAPPWNSRELSVALGVEPPSDEDRHTALGDARWAKRVYDRVLGSV